MKWAIVTLISIFICLTAYRMIGWDDQGNLLAHSYSVWGDWSAHFTFISSFKERGLSWITGDNPIFHDVPFRYPFLSHLLTALWGSITFSETVEATLCSSLALLFALPFVIFRFYSALGLNSRQSILSLLLFVFMGGVQIFDSDLSSNDAFTNQFNSGSIMTQFILFELIPQRAFLFGITIFLGVLTYLVNKIKNNQTDSNQVKSGLQYLGCAVLFSLLSWTHIHSWMAMGMLLVIAVLVSSVGSLSQSRSRSKNMSNPLDGFTKNSSPKFFSPVGLFGFSITTLVTSLPLLYFLLIRGDTTATHSISWKIWAPGWAQNQSANIPVAQEMNFFFFWLYNSGLFFPLVFLGVYTWIKWGKYEVGTPNTSHPNLKYQSKPRLGGTSMPSDELTTISPEPEPSEATERVTGSSQTATSPESETSYLKTIHSGAEKSGIATLVSNLFGFFKDKKSYQSIPTKPVLSCFNEFILITSLTGASLFAVSLLFQFQPYFYDNLKILTYGFLFLTPLAAIGLDSFFKNKSSPYNENTVIKTKIAEIPQAKTDNKSQSPIPKNLFSIDSGSEEKITSFEKIRKKLSRIPVLISAKLKNIKNNPKQYLLITLGAAILALQSSTAIRDYLFYLNQNQTTSFLTREEFEISRKFNAIRKSANSLVLINPKHNHWVTTLSGNPVLIGYQGWLWSWGIAYSTREKEAAAILLGTPWAEGILAKYPIQYIVVHEQDQIANRPVDIQFLKLRFKLEIKHGNWLVFNVSQTPNMD